MTDPGPRVVAITVPDWLGALALLVVAFGVVVGAGLGWAIASAPAATDADSGADRLPDVRIWQAPVIPTAVPDLNALADAQPRRPAGNADAWPHDVFAAVRDPNVLQAGFAPARLEDAAGEPPASGPRLAVGGVDVGLTRDLGTLASDRPTTTTLLLGNVGDAPLTVGRIYFGSSAVGLASGGSWAADATGRFEQPLVLAPGEAEPLELTVDPRRLTATGTQAVYLQLFTDDPRLEPFADGNPFDREARVRLVLAARPASELLRPIGSAEVTLAPGVPRVWLPELTRDARGGDVATLETPPPNEPMTLELKVRNLGDAPLRLGVDPSSVAVDVVLANRDVPAGGSTTISVRLEPSSGLDDGPHVRRTLRLSTNDPLAPLIAVDLVGQWVSSAPDAPDDDPNQTSEAVRGYRNR